MTSQTGMSITRHETTVYCEDGCCATAELPSKCCEPKEWNSWMMATFVLGGSLVVVISVVIVGVIVKKKTRKKERVGTADGKAPIHDISRFYKDTHGVTHDVRPPQYDDFMMYPRDNHDNDVPGNVFPRADHFDYVTFPCADKDDDVMGHVNPRADQDIEVPTIIDANAQNMPRDKTSPQIPDYMLVLDKN
ncbi:uncharacterized protein LOC127877632 isoform X2 [Dreissena polymorpha]|nr:uncharacterized protein LOC127877632 isoform X2 [Dreissena polymorpha]